MQEFDEFKDLDDGYDTVTMTDDNGIEREYAVLDAVEQNGTTYLLVAENDFADSDAAEAEAVILKELRQNDEEVIYACVEDDEEFNAVAVLFQSSGEDYDIEL